MSEEILAFYRRCSAARLKFQTEAARSVPVPKVLEHARRLGLPMGDELSQISDGELAYAFDLATYSAPPGRSRAIDRLMRRYASLQTEAALVLNALTHSWFSVFRVSGHHKETGLILEDTLLGGEIWAVDEALAETAAIGSVFGTRLGRVRGFAITGGVVGLLDEAWLARVRRLVGDNALLGELAADQRFIEAIWRHALGFDAPEDLG